MVWRLPEFLRSRGISVYALAQAAQGEVSRNSLYALVRPGGPKRVELRTLDVVVRALRRITGEDVNVSDLLVWVGDEGGDGHSTV